MKPEPYTLTEADLMDLRVRMKYPGFVRDGSEGVMLAAPWLTYLLASHEYVVHSQGFVVAVTPSDDVACWLLRNERIEPGYCRAILDPACDVTVALQSPEARAAHIRARNAEAATQRLQRQEAEEAARRRRTRLQPLDASNLSIEDLFT